MLFKKLVPIAFIAVFTFTSCNSEETKPEEKAEIEEMDSTSKAVKESREKLKEQTNKVEESLEKLDEEFDSTN